MSLNGYAKECLFLSLMELMEQKKFQDISITELSEKAGFSRMTFYRNYTTKEDILIEYIQQCTESILLFFKANKDVEVVPFLELFFFTFRKEQRFLKNLITSDLTYLLNLAFQKNAEILIKEYEDYGWYEDAIIEPYKIRFLAGGLIEVLISWAQKSMTESDTEMAQKVSRYLQM